MADDYKEKFEELCREFYAEKNVVPLSDSIGTYNEKRLHKILKETVCSDKNSYEVKIGKCVADVFCNNTVYEIQTGNFSYLQDKIEYYLENTDFDINIIYPVISEKRIMRVDRETGEVIRSRKSPAKVDVFNVMEQLFYISRFLKNRRIKVDVLYICAEEHRYSDEVHRYRKSGRYDSETFPRSVEKVEHYCGAESFEFLLDGCPEKFFAKEYAFKNKIKGRKIYRTLNLLCNLEILKKEKTDSRSYIYSTAF